MVSTRSDGVNAARRQAEGVPHKDPEENRRYQREWAARNPEKMRRKREREKVRMREKRGYKGGSYRTMGRGLSLLMNGRCRIRCRDGTFVYFYRAVVEAELGRHLRPDEIVHHINGDHTDDRLENLMVMSQADHAALHAAEAVA